jgi:hypothetical protein
LIAYEFSQQERDDALAAFDERTFPGQGKLLYCWEVNVFAERDKQELTLDECRALINNVWVKQLSLTAPPPAVLDGRGSCDARTTATAIHLPRWARNKPIVIHELSHSVTDLFDEASSIDHSSKFIQVYLTLLGNNTQYRYRALRTSARKYGLKVSNMNVWETLKQFRA